MLVIVLANRLDSYLLQLIPYGSDTGLTLGNNILQQDFSELPDYARLYY